MRQLALSEGIIARMLFGAAAIVIRYLQNRSSFLLFSGV